MAEIRAAIEADRLGAYAAEFYSLRSQAPGPDAG
jgi:hypothetical protein